MTDYKNNLIKGGSKILHTYSHKVGGKPVYFVKNKHTEKRHKQESEMNKVRGEINAKAEALNKLKNK